MTGRTAEELCARIGVHLDAAPSLERHVLEPWRDAGLVQRDEQGRWSATPRAVERFGAAFGVIEPPVRGRSS